ncbi:MAG: LLM class flavin-dependent oxidoreductase [Dehalococcoidia bacterium]|nr:LLM class flavin-dependent oxidoreductase [Dehalococcoidia bacterium]
MSPARSVDLELDASGALPIASVPTLAAEAEAAGLGGVWKGETSNRDPFVLLASAAVATHSIALGTSIAHVLARSPVAAAMAAASLSELSRGRFILGLGVANPTLAAWHGASFRRPLAMAREYLTIVRAILAGERVSRVGEHFSTRDFRLGGPVPTRPTPIALAALGPRMSALAGAIADGVIINLANPDAIREIVANARHGAERAGRDPDSLDVVAKVRVAIASDEAAARAALRPTVAVYLRAPGYRELLLRMGLADSVAKAEAAWQANGYGAAIRAIDDRMLDTVPTLALRTAAELPSRLQPYWDAGVTRVIVPLIAVGNDPEGETRAFIRQWAAISR